MVQEYNASDERQVKDATSKVELERKQELEDIKRILGTHEGMRFFKRLLKEGMVFQTTFRGNSQGYFLEGHRNLALKFFHDVAEAAPNKIAELVMDRGQKQGGA